jgi:hypothetical protein
MRHVIPTQARCILRQNEQPRIGFRTAIIGGKSPPRVAQPVVWTIAAPDLSPSRDGSNTQPALRRCRCKLAANWPSNHRYTSLRRSRMSFRLLR